MSQVSKVADDTFGLITWYGKYGTAWCNEYRDKKAAEGTAFHHILETTLKGKNIDLKQYEGPVNACMTFLTHLNLQYVNSEVHGENKKLDLEGTYDCLVNQEINPKDKIIFSHKILIDWKLTSGLRVSNYVQGGGYALLHPDLFKEYMVVRPYELKVEPKQDSKVIGVSDSTRYKWKGKLWALEVRHFKEGELNQLTRMFKKCLDIVKFREEIK